MTHVWLLHRTAQAQHAVLAGGSVDNLLYFLVNHQAISYVKVRIFDMRETGGRPHNNPSGEKVCCGEIQSWYDMGNHEDLAGVREMF